MHLREILLLAAPAAAAFGQSPGHNAVILDNPCPKKQAYFGHAVCVLDMDGSGGSEVAVGAFGAGRAYILHDVTLAGRQGGFEVLSALGQDSCTAAQYTDQFGYDLAGGNLDGDPLDELVVGVPFASVGPVERAGVVYIFRDATDPTPLLLRALDPTPAWLGVSVVVGDFDGDGLGDVAASAPKADVGGFQAGAVYIFFGPFGSVPRTVVLPNPAPVDNGNFGNHLAVADTNLDGLDDLVVGAIGNANTAGIPVAGQVYVYPGPIAPSQFLLIEDPLPDAGDLPAPRFAMHVAARGEWVLVGANRKDWLGIHDAGMGFSARGPSLAPVDLYPHPFPGPSDYMGFRCVVADVVGDPALDLTFVVMGSRRELVTWDGNTPYGPPVRLRRILPRSGDHFANGFVAAQLVAGGREELVVGDPTYDLGGTGAGKDVGRVVVYSYE